MANFYDGDIPFCDGHQVSYPEVRDTDWMPNHTFADTLVVDRIERGRSAAHFIFTRLSNDKEVTVFMADVIPMMKQGMINGQVTGKFTFCKRGMNYGCKLYGG